ncbi:MAG: hypothetical protein MNPFHGCM_01774 [Gemmatimonadaceae bacterium]|nr:hypothetical protein [Gemmatimonadaceae bacterium]
MEWRRFLAGLLLFLAVPFIPHLRIVAPIQETITFIAPAMAVCALLGWRAGGRWQLAVIWVLLAIWSVGQPISTDRTYDAIARSWAMLLAAAFGVVSLLNEKRAFFPRALSATALTIGVVGCICLARPESMTRYATTLSGAIEARGEEELANWNATASTKEWKALEDGNQTIMNMSAEVVRFWQEVPKVTAVAAPALLALESLAALALVWGLYHRVSRVRLGAPLGRLRDFRFNDQLVWGLVTGITMIVLPSLAPLRLVGINLLVFLGVLYLLRGLGVLSWFLAPRRIALALLVVVAILSWPIIGIFSLGLGLGDTWLDLRRRARPTS